MFRNILIATDGSELSDKLLAPGTALARALGAKITGVHVVPEHMPTFSGEMAWANETLRARFRESAREMGDRYLDRMEAAAREAHVPFERVLAPNDHVWKGIIATADDKGCDVIMMAAHGRRGLGGLVLGSETNRVLVHSRTPVLVYR